MILCIQKDFKSNIFFFFILLYIALFYNIIGQFNIYFFLIFRIKSNLKNYKKI